MQNAVSKHQAVYEFSVGTRLTHWLRVISIIILVGTGFYLSFAFHSPMPSNGEPVSFMQAKYRFAHEVAGFVLIACIIFKCYLFFTDRVSSRERISLENVRSGKIWLEQIKFYLFLGKHPKIKGVYNPLQFVSYTLFYLVIFGIILTGLILYAHSYHEGLGGLLSVLRPIEAWLGGLAEVRVWHHILMWAVLFFVCVHIYMAVFNTIKGRDGAIDAIFGGYRFEKDEGK